MNKLFKLLVIGTGSIGERHVRCALSSGRAEVWVCETRDEARNAVADLYPLSGVFSDLERALVERFDGCIIATPAHTHIRIAQRCVEAGLHVLIEKPLALDVAEVPALQVSVVDQGLVAAVAYVWRCHPLLRRLQEQLASGTWGEPLQLCLVSGQHFPTYRPAYAQTYYRSQSTGGGIIYDALSHMLNVGSWLLGPITRLTADADHLALPDVDVPDTVHVIARHGKVMANYAMNQHQSPNQNTITLCCTEATVELEVHSNRLRIMRRPDTDWEVQAVTPPSRDTAFVQQFNAFLDAIENLANPVCSLAEGLQTQLAINAVFAAVSGGWQNVPTTSMDQPIEPLRLENHSILAK